MIVTLTAAGLMPFWQAWSLENCMYGTACMDAWVTERVSARLDNHCMDILICEFVRIWHCDALRACWWENLVEYGRTAPSA